MRSRSRGHLHQRDPIEQGRQIAGLLPDDVQMPTNYAAAIPVGAASPDVAKAFLQEFKTPFAHEVIRKVGLEPLSR